MTVSIRLNIKRKQNICIAHEIFNTATGQLSDASHSHRLIFNVVSTRDILVANSKSSSIIVQLRYSLHYIQC